MTTRVAVEVFRTDDAEAVAEVRRAAVPYLVCTAGSVAWEAASAPAHRHTRWLVARESGGRITGCADAGLLIESTEADESFLHTAVHPDALGYGVGGALVAAGEHYLAELGARRVYTWVSDDGRSPGFAERRGYVRGRRARFLGLDLTRSGLPALLDPLPDGVEILTGQDFAENQRPLYEAELECRADEPGDVRAGFVPYEDWLRLHWECPDIEHRLSSVVLLGGEVAAYSLAQTDGRKRYWSGMTGARRAYRGRGLARLAKLDSLHRSRTAGYTHAFTGNDAANAPMLALNESLGYVRTAAEWRYVKEL
jgi:GNAT superfamily N-acetyltransferase